MFNGVPLLGFRHMVAPINKTEGAKDTLFGDKTLLGDVYKLPRELDATAKMAPNLHVVLRQVLESKEVQGEIVTDFLEHNPSIKRYNSSFKLLWAILTLKMIDPTKANLEQIASAIIEINGFSPSQARNAYSAMLLFPNFYHLKFHQLLSPYKKAWNSSIEKYGAFWNCEPILFDLAKRIPHGIDDPNLAFAFDVKELRERLIIVCRLLCLFRSVDLSRLSRNISILDGKVPFIMIQKKVEKRQNGRDSYLFLSLLKLVLGI